MSEVILNRVQKMLNEEKFTRAALSNYSTAQFKELDDILSEAKAAHCYTELKKLCAEHLTHSRNSIIAEYFSGMVDLSEHIIDDAALVNLVTMFVDNHKWNIVKYLCERVLDFGESKFALRTLGECYKNENDEQHLFEVWKRLVKVDYEEADIAKALGDHADKEGNLDEAVDYYKKALNRSITKGVFTNVREIWQKLLEYRGDDIDFFLNIQAKIAKNIATEKAEVLLWDVYNVCRKKKLLDTAIQVLKLILGYDSGDINARKEITECYREKYAGHSQLEEYIKISNLYRSQNQNYRNVHEAIADFEKHISFDKGNFVFHRSWKVGRISSVEGDDIIIDFAKKRAHTMSLKMAVDALQTLSKDHIWVLKAAWKKEKLYEKVKNDVNWALRVIIKSYDNHCSLKQVKAELVPAVLSAGEWTNWNIKAKKALEAEDSIFGVDSENIDVLTVRDRPLSLEEKLYNEFKAEKKFFKRASKFREFTQKVEVEAESELFMEMIEYFEGFLKTANEEKEYIVASYLILKDVAGRFPQFSPKIEFNWVTIFELIENPAHLYTLLKDEKLQHSFLHQIKLFTQNWQDVYITLFPKVLFEPMLKSLEEAGEEDKIVTMIKNCFENYKMNREAVVWFYKNYRNNPLYKRASLSIEKEIITLLYILDITFREIDNHRDTTENKKINKTAWTLLFSGGILGEYFSSAPRESIIRIWTLVEDISGLDPADKVNLREIIRERFSDFKFAGTTEKGSATRKLLVTAEKYDEKQRRLKHIMEVEVPANSKEIGFALSLGDLRENAEYKAAKEKQELLNSTVAKLKSEIDRAQIFDMAQTNTTSVSFGTKVTLRDENSGNEEIYTILGPWESDPDNKIISYLSPFGEAMLGKSSGERFEFALGDEKSAFVVKNIDRAAAAS
ncbi:MAG: transcription elongation factor GreA [Spirochaetaceae bacterium]|jgi:transcription elongation factor GreA|nr:transcription elongation factor GreA [Spirochaetaceae bacterium]GMO21712.1 MAG: transcription elongation factor GreA [Termitinemataceae bacterium]